MQIKNLRVIFVVLGAVVFYIFWGRNANHNGQENFSCEFPQRIETEDLRYVRHAECRMDCRKVSQDLVEDVYLHGKVNCRKSGMNKGAPRWALEKKDPLNGDQIRLIVEEEAPAKHVIITVIRLDKKFDCDC